MRPPCGYPRGLLIGLPIYFLSITYTADHSVHSEYYRRIGGAAIKKAIGISVGKGRTGRINRPGATCATQRLIFDVPRLSCLYFERVYCFAGSPPRPRLRPRRRRPSVPIPEAGCDDGGLGAGAGFAGCDAAAGAGRVACAGGAGLFAIGAVPGDEGCPPRRCFRPRRRSCDGVSTMLLGAGVSAAAGRSCLGLSITGPRSTTAGCGRGGAPSFRSRSSSSSLATATIRSLSSRTLTSWVRIVVSSTTPAPSLVRTRVFVRGSFLRSSS